MPTIIDPTIYQVGVPADKTEAAAELTKIKNKFYGVINLKDCGAALDGTTDDTDALQEALDAVNADLNGPTTILIHGDCVLNPSALTWGTRDSIVIEVNGRLRLTSSLRLPAFSTLRGIGGAAAVPQFGRPGAALVTTNNFSGPAIIAAGDNATIRIENISVYLHEGGAGIHVGHLEADVGATQTALVWLDGVSVQCADVPASEGLRIENTFWLWVTQFAFCGDSSSGPSINIADSYDPGNFNCSILLYFQDGVISHHGVHFNRSTAGASSYGYAFSFRNMCYESGEDACFVFNTTNVGFLSQFTMDQIDIADPVSMPSFIDVQGDANLRDFQISSVTWMYCPMFSGNVDRVSGVNWRQADGPFTPYQTLTAAITNVWPQDSSFTFEGELYGRVGFRGSDHVPHMVPANCAIVNTDQDGSSWSTLIGTPTITAGQTAPDGSATAVRIQAAGVETHVVMAESSSAVNDWFIGGCWVRNNSAAIPCVWAPGLITPGGELLYGHAELNRPIKKTLYEASSGWTLVVIHDKIVTNGSSARLLFTGIDETDIIVWNPFLIRVPAALNYTTLDAARLAANMKQVSPTAKPGVVAQLDHQTFRTGLGATGSRPSASAVGAGAMWYDTSISKLIVSDGSSWLTTDGGTP